MRGFNWSRAHLSDSDVPELTKDVFAQVFIPCLGGSRSMTSCTCINKTAVRKAPCATSCHSLSTKCWPPESVARTGLDDGKSTKVERSMPSRSRLVEGNWGILSSTNPHIDTAADPRVKPPART